MQFRKGFRRLLKCGNNIIRYIKNNPQEKYFIKITKIYTDDENGEVMVRYFVPTCGISGNITSSEFMSSPLIFAVHPVQIYSLGTETGKYVFKIDGENNPFFFPPTNSRVKRYLH